MPRHKDMRLPDEAGRVVSRYLELVDEALPDRVEARFDRSIQPGLSPLDG